MSISRTIQNLLCVAAGATASYVLVRFCQKKHTSRNVSISSLVDRIKCYTDGVLSDCYIFGWDDDEQCSWAKCVHFDSNGKVESERLIEVEYLEDKIVAKESYEQDNATPVVTTYLLDSFGMIYSSSERKPNGREQRWNWSMNGNELVQRVSDNSSYTYHWEDANIEYIVKENGDLTELTYYKNTENYIFPDLNILCKGFSSKMLMSYLMGMKSSNYVSTITHKNGSHTENISASYFVDHFDRPLQILHEITSSDDNFGKTTRKLFEITYVEQ